MHNFKDNELKKAAVEEHIKAENSKEGDVNSILNNIINTFISDELGQIAYIDPGWNETCNNKNEVKNHYQALINAVPDCHIEVNDMYVIDENRVIVQAEFTGKHTAFWKGLPPTNKSLKFPLNAIFIVKNEEKTGLYKIEQEHVLYDTQNLMDQLGIFRKFDSVASQVQTTFFHPSATFISTIYNPVQASHEIKISNLDEKLKDLIEKDIRNNFPKEIKMAFSGIELQIEKCLPDIESDSKENKKYFIKASVVATHNKTWQGALPTGQKINIPIWINVGPHSNGTNSNKVECYYDKQKIAEALGLRFNPNGFLGAIETMFSFPGTISKGVATALLNAFNELIQKFFPMSTPPRLTPSH